MEFTFPHFFTALLALLASPGEAGACMVLELDLASRISAAAALLGAMVTRTKFSLCL